MITSVGNPRIELLIEIGIHKIRNGKTRGHVSSGPNSVHHRKYCVTTEERAALAREANYFGRVGKNRDPTIDLVENFESLGIGQQQRDEMAVFVGILDEITLRKSGP